MFSGKKIYEVTATFHDLRPSKGQNIKKEKDMNKLLILSIVASMAMSGTVSMAQGHRHTPRTETTPADSLKELRQAAKSTAKQAINVARIAANTTLNQAEEDLDKETDDEGQEAFSDTTQTADSMAAVPVTILDDTDGDEDHQLQIVRQMGLNMVWIVAICLIIFVLAPVLILFVIFYFIYRDRRQRMRIAEMALQNGQPIPEELLGKKRRQRDAGSFRQRSAGRPSYDNAAGQASAGRGSAHGETPDRSGSVWGIPLWFDARDPQFKRGLKYCFSGAVVCLLGFSASSFFLFGLGFLLIVYGAGIGAFAVLEQRRAFNFEQMSADEASGNGEPSARETADRSDTTEKTASAEEDWMENENKQ